MTRPCTYSAIALLAALLAALPASGQGPRGLWLLPRKDAANTARADVPGDMSSAPRVVWSYGSQLPSYSWAQPVTVAGRPAYLVLMSPGLALVRPDGTRAWSCFTLGASAVVEVLEPGALVMLGQRGLALVDVASGKVRWRWYAPAGLAVAERATKLVWVGGERRLVVFPNGPTGTMGYCFGISRGGRVRQLWRRDYGGRYWANFGPTIAAAEMDRDGQPEVVVAGKPAYLGVVALGTGEVKCELRYRVPGDSPDTGRPYGLLALVDLDGDGYRDVVLASSAVEEYLSVVRNRGGRRLELAWSHFVTWNYPSPTKELHPDVTSLADVNGDGRPELVIGLYNENGDERWHTLVLNPLAGYRGRLVDLPGRYFWGCQDLDGDGQAEILTSTPQGREATFPPTLQAVEGKGGRDLARLEGATLVVLAGRLPGEVSFGAARTSPLAVTMPDGRRGVVVTQAGREWVWRVEGGKGVLAPFDCSVLSRVVVYSQGGGQMPAPDLAIAQAAGPGERVAAFGPLVAEGDGQRELVLSRSDGVIVGGTPDLARGEGLTGEWRVRGSMPSLWLGPAGERVVCAVKAPDTVCLYRPQAGQQSAEPVSQFTTALPVTMAGRPRSTACLVPFGRELRLLVGMDPGRHPHACGVYDAAGRSLWLDRENGPYPRAAGVGDLNGDGQEEFVVDYMGRHLFYSAQGQGRLVAHGWNNTIPGRGDGAKYSLPIIGPFGPAGEVRVVMSPGLDALESLGPAGERLARQPYGSTYEFDWCSAAVARLRPGQWDLGMASSEGVFHCAEVATCRSRWTLDLGVKATSAISVVSGDLDGDGRDNFLVSLPDGRLLCLDEVGGRGRVRWEVRFEAAVGEAIIADVEGDGRAEIVACLDSGEVKVLKGGR